MKNKIYLILSVTLILSFLTACAPTLTPTATKEKETEPVEGTEAPPDTQTPTTQKEKVEIVVWHGDSDAVAKITKELIETEFNELYPNIEVKYELAPEPFKEKLLVTVPAGTGPDLFEWNHDWIGSLAKAGVIQPIDDLVSSELQQKYVSSAFKAGKYEEELYTLPISAEAGALAYNKSFLGDNPVPETTDEMVALMDEFHGDDKYGISYPFVPFLVSGYIHAFDGWLWDDAKSSLGVNSPETKAAMEWVLETYKPYMSNDPSWDPQVALFPEGKALFAVNGPWATGSWTDAGIDFGITPLPKISEIDEMPQPYIGVKSIYMTNNVENREAAFKFMEWATTSKQRILQRATELGYIPVLKEVKELPEIQEDPVLSGFADQVALGIPMSSSPEMTAVWGPLDEALRAMFNDVKTVDEALDDAQEEIEEAIQELE